MSALGSLSGYAVPIAAAGGYLLGSIPFGLLLTRLAGRGDVRKIGSGNIGATNVLRTGSKGLAAATLLLDGAKGALACLLASSYGQGVELVAGFSAILGHNYPVWLWFRGGKGVSTSLGVWLALAWPVGLLAGGTWLVTALVFRYSSLAALVGLAAAPLYAYWLSGPSLAIAGLGIALLAAFRHRDNIDRLLKGTEGRIGQKAPSKASD